MVCGLQACQLDAPQQGVTDAELCTYRASSRVEDILTGMTLEDKVGEMTQLTLDVLCVGENHKAEEPHRLDSIRLDSAFAISKIGSVLNSAGHSYPTEQWRELIGEIQAASLNAKGIPTLYGIDAIHGATYTYGAALGPQQLALAATWDTALVRVMAEGTAKEIMACGIPWNFAPVLDVGRDPRWPRFLGDLRRRPKTCGRHGGSHGPRLSGRRGESGCHAETLFGLQHALEWKRQNAGVHP